MEQEDIGAEDGNREGFIKLLRDLTYFFAYSDRDENLDLEPWKLELEPFSLQDTYNSSPLVFSIL